MTDVQPEEQALAVTTAGRRKGATGRKTGYKPTKAERTQRITEVYKLLIIGLQRHDIIRYLAEKTAWELADRTVDLYIARATEQITAHAKFERASELGKAILRLNDLYARTTKIQDYKTAMAIQRELNELMGLYAPTRLDLPPGDGPASFIAVMPYRPANNQEWEQMCRQQQATKPPTVIVSTLSGEE